MQTLSGHNYANMQSRLLASNHRLVTRIYRKAKRTAGMAVRPSTQPAQPN